VEALLAKPSKKPAIGPVTQSKVLQRAAQFMPEFIKTTDKILSDPAAAAKAQMDIVIAEKQQEGEGDNEEEKDATETTERTFVNMVLYSA